MGPLSMFSSLQRVNGFNGFAMICLGLSPLLWGWFFSSLFLFFEDDEFFWLLFFAWRLKGSWKFPESGGIIGFVYNERWQWCTQVSKYNLPDRQKRYYVQSEYNVLPNQVYRECEDEYHRPCLLVSWLEICSVIDMIVGFRSDPYLIAPVTMLGPCRLFYGVLTKKRIDSTTLHELQLEI
jgi:hypothetical protein